MARISTNIILDGISLALRKEFPDSHIESNAIQQGLRPPAFIVHLVTATTDAYPMQRQRRLPRFDILNFPKGNNEECYDVADTLCSVLKVIELPGGDKIRGIDMNFEVVDDVLHFFVSYLHFTYEEKQDVKMETLEIRQGDKRNG